jgi:hypothetical protein
MACPPRPLHGIASHSTKSLSSYLQYPSTNSHTSPCIVSFPSPAPMFHILSLISNITSAASNLHDRALINHYVHTHNLSTRPPNPEPALTHRIRSIFMDNRKMQRHLGVAKAATEAPYLRELRKPRATTSPVPIRGHHHDAMVRPTCLSPLLQRCLPPRL